MEDHPIILAVRKAYCDAADPTVAAGMQKYLKTDMLFHGIKTPQRREISKAIFKQFPIKDLVEYIEVVCELWDGEHREEKYCAISLACRYKRYQVLEALPMYQMMIETGAWWDLVDGVAIELIGSLLRNYPVIMKKILKSWINDENIWIRRSAIISQVRFKKETDSEMLFTFCREHLHETSFWIRKAIGWALREYSKSEPDRVRDFVKEFSERMSGLTRREAGKYIG
jgi:3-methyladenine DNA glycosylase AlkD